MAKKVIVLDLGGVLMKHDMEGCLGKFEILIGKEGIAKVLGLQTNGEGKEETLVDKYERGDISTRAFVDAVLAHAKEGATEEQVIDAWNTMHGGIPQERLDMVGRWAAEGQVIYMLSNNNELHWEHVNRLYDLSMFEHCFASHLLHVAKPDRKIYEIVDKEIKAREGEVMCRFVDDLAANRKAAQDVGWESFETIEELDKVLEGEK